MAMGNSFIFILFALLLCFVCYSSKEANAFEVEEGSRNNYHFVPLLSLLPATVCSTTTNVSTQGINDKRAVLELVDKHGPCSHLSHEKTRTPTEILLRDQSRVDSLNSKFKTDAKRLPIQNSDVTLPANSGLSLGTLNFIVTVGIGTPKRQFSVVFDTGSDLTWIQCKPCVRYCYPQQEPIFNPSESTSYSNVSCNSAECAQLTSATGIPPDCSSSSCIYGVEYGDQSYSAGFFCRDTLTLTDSDVFPNFLFGCGQNNRGLFGRTAGLIGLGRNKLSLVSQTNKKYGGVFSYCLPSSSSSTGYLTLGNSGSGSSSNVKFTPLVTNSRNPSFYFLNMIGISVGGSKLAISASVFTNSGVIIDSGTVITRLPESAYSALSSAFKKLMSNYPSAPAFSILDTCFDFSKNDTVLIPKIALLFEGGTMVDIDSSGVFYGVSLSQMCLAFAGNSDSGDLAILGNKQQQTLEVIYDVMKGRLGFGAGGCK